MTDKALSTWKDYSEFFNGCNRRTAKKKLLRLGFKVPDDDAPILCISMIKERIEEQQAKL